MSLSIETSIWWVATILCSAVTFDIYQTWWWYDDIYQTWWWYDVIYQTWWWYDDIYQTWWWCHPAASQPPEQRMTILSHLGGSASKLSLCGCWHQGEGVEHSQHSVFFNITIWCGSQQSWNKWHLPNKSWKERFLLTALLDWWCWWWWWFIINRFSNSTTIMLI